MTEPHTPTVIEQVVEAFHANYNQASSLGMWHSDSAQFGWEQLARAALLVATQWIRDNPCGACNLTRSDCDNLAEQLWNEAMNG